MMTRWGTDLKPMPTVERRRPARTPQPCPRRVLISVRDQVGQLARDLDQSLHAASNDANEVALEPVCELLMWLEACRDEAGRIASTLEARR
jgi:hypothetical protein